MAAIIATGATTVELEEAIAWIEADDAMGDVQPPANPVVDRLIQILQGQLGPEPTPTQ